jgi:sec-independent protein translocase protein TatA
MPNIGPVEIIVVLVIALLVLGPKRLPDAGRSIGSAIRGFKDGVTGKGDAPAIEHEYAATLATPDTRVATPVD